MVGFGCGFPVLQVLSILERASGVSGESLAVSGDQGAWAAQVWVCPADLTPPRAAGSHLAHLHPVHK